MWKDIKMKRFFPVLQASCLALLPFASTSAQSAPPPPDTLQAPERELSQAELRRIERRWNREWRNFANCFVKFEGNYYCFPNYDPDRPSSHPMTTEEYIRHTAYEFRYRSPERDNNVFVVTKSIEDAQAATSLIYIPKPGVYGYIHSGILDEIQESEFKLTEVKLVDWDAIEAKQPERQAWMNEQISACLPAGFRDKGGVYREPLAESLIEANRFRMADRKYARRQQTRDWFAALSWRMIGFEIQGARQAQHWPRGDQGLHLAILSVDDHLVTAVNPDWIGRGISELDVLNALEQHGYSKTDFIELVDQTRREDLDDYIRRALETIVEQHQPEQEDGQPEAQGD
ncbi:MAG: hypothetical protein AAGH88_11590 [Planctomycetota bacterium]